MNIKMADHGRSIIEQLQSDMRENSDKIRKQEPQNNQLALLKDVFTRSDLSKTSMNHSSETDPETSPDSSGTIQSDSLNIAFQFDLFYELTSKVEAKMGKSGANRFAELSGTVSETFMGSFKLSIDAVGSFMNGTEKSLEISPETTSEFFDAVEGLADLSPEALENFLVESDKFFAGLEEKYGKADGAFGKIKNVMQEQAKQFFADVTAAREHASESIADAPTSKSHALPETAADVVSPDKTDTGKGPLIELVFQPGKKVEQDSYKSFLEDFLNYANKFKQQMFENFFKTRLSGYDAQASSAPEKISDHKSIDTAI